MRLPISWERACDQCDKVHHLHEVASSRAEYGVNWYEFINTDDHLYRVVQEWWDTLTNDKKRFYIEENIRDLKSALQQAQEALQEIQSKAIL